LTGPDGPAPGAPDWGAFVPGPRLRREGASAGPLAGARVAVKDLFDIEGVPTGCGSPDWPGAGVPAERDAWAVRRLLDAGATVVGKAVTDEVSLGLLGRNRHLGTPGNPLDPTRMPGGSSSGSAVAVAAGLADLGLGSDSGGSVRVPASLLGLWGMRPTHGSIPADGLMVQSPSLDTVGLIARSPEMLERGMAVLLPPDRAEPRGAMLAMVEVDEGDRPLEGVLARARPMIEAALGSLDPVAMPMGLDAWAETIATVQAAEFGATFAPWLDSADPRLSWGVAEALAAALAIDPEAVRRAREARATLVADLDRWLGDRLLVLPTLPCAAPSRDLPLSELARIDRCMVRYLCLAGLSGRPQVTMPVMQLDGLPVGLSLVGPRHSDRAILAIASSLAVRAVERTTQAKDRGR
jgi:amidase